MLTAIVFITILSTSFAIVTGQHPVLNKHNGIDGRYSSNIASIIRIASPIVVPSQLIRGKLAPIRLPPTIEKDKNGSRRIPVKPNQRAPKLAARRQSTLNDTVPPIMSASHQTRVKLADQEWQCQLKLYNDVSSSMKHSNETTPRDRLFFLLPMIFVYWRHRYPNTTLYLRDVDMFLQELGPEARYQREAVEKMMSRLDEDWACADAQIKPRMSDTSSRGSYQETTQQQQQSEISFLPKSSFRELRGLLDVITNNRRNLDLRPQRRNEPPSNTRIPDPKVIGETRVSQPQPLTTSVFDKSVVEVSTQPEYTTTPSVQQPNQNDSSTTTTTTTTTATILADSEIGSHDKSNPIVLNVTTVLAPLADLEVSNTSSPADRDIALYNLVSSILEDVELIDNSTSIL